MTRTKVASRNDLDDGEMKQVSVGDTDILLSRVAGHYYAIGAHCTHYGAPLAEGALHHDQVICPWHHACFRVTTGEQLEPPGMDSLTRFALDIDGDDVYVTIPDDAQNSVTAKAARRDMSDTRLFVIVGGGTAGVHAAQTLRQQGFAGRLVMLSRDPYPPYDRTNLSKQLEAADAPEELKLRDADFYDQNDIERITAEVTNVDATSKTLTLADGETMRCDALLLATGGTPRALPLPGADLANVFTLRSVDDTKAILAAARKGQRAVVVGASFIGMEVASSLREQTLEVTVVAPDEVPFAATLGPEVGRAIQAAHEGEGTRFILGSQPTRFEDDNSRGSVQGVVLDSGERLETDLVVIGVGVFPETEAVTGVSKGDDGGIVVDAALRAAEGVYVAGDIARFPHPATGESVCVEHWRVAAQHGRVAARAMLGQDVQYSGVPFFWTEQPDMKLRYVGHATAWDEIRYDGSPKEGKFIAYYVKGGKVIAAAGAGRDTDLAAFHQRLRANGFPSPDTLGV